MEDKVLKSLISGNQHFIQHFSVRIQPNKKLFLSTPTFNSLIHVVVLVVIKSALD